MQNCITVSLSRHHRKNNGQLFHIVCLITYILEELQIVENAFYLIR